MNVNEEVGLPSSLLNEAWIEADIPSTNPVKVLLIEIASFCWPASITNKSLDETGIPGGDWSISIDWLTLPEYPLSLIILAVIEWKPDGMFWFAWRLNENIDVL